jgi:hypothetical protein
MAEREYKKIKSDEHGLRIEREEKDENPKKKPSLRR